MDTAQDITQEVFIKLYEKRDQINIQTSLKSYLFAAVRNKSLDTLKSEKNKAGLLEKIKNTSNSDEDIEDDRHRVALQSKLYTAIQSLPAQNQLIFKLSRFEGKSNQEIANQLDLSKRTVETHISNALKRIKTILKSIVILLIFS